MGPCVTTFLFFRQRSYHTTNCASARVNTAIATNAGEVHGGRERVTAQINTIRTFDQSRATGFLQAPNPLCKNVPLREANDALFTRRSGGSHGISRHCLPRSALHRTQHHDRSTFCSFKILKRQKTKTFSPAPERLNAPLSPKLKGEEDDPRSLATQSQSQQHHRASAPASGLSFDDIPRPAGGGGSCAASWRPPLPHGAVGQGVGAVPEGAECARGEGGGDDISLAGLSVASGDSMQYSVDSG